mgnify:CR=1 FL=1
MNKTTLNILTPIPFWHPGTQELIDGLKQNNFEVVALDIWSFNYYDENQQIVNLVPKFFRGRLERIYKRVFRNKIIKKYINKDQIVDIQWCGHYYSKYIDLIKASSRKLYATLFGSDLYRNSNENRLVQRKIFEVADKIVMGINMKEEFEVYFKGFTNKILFAQFGSKRLDLINDLIQSYDQLATKKKYHIPQSKTIVTVGYNSKPEQQHIVFFDMLKKISLDVKDKIFLIIPLTYG